MVNTKLNLVKSRFEKQKLLEKTCIQVLQRNPEGINTEEFIQEVKAKLEEKREKASRATIFNMIKKLENAGILRIERDRKDRRKAIYKPNIEKAKTETRKFEVEEFLNSLENPESFEETRKMDDMKITFSIFIEGRQKKAKLPPSIILEGAFPTIKAWLESYMKPAKIQKFAMFIGAEKGNK